MKTPPTSTNVDLIAIVDPHPVFKRGFRQTLSQSRAALEVIEAVNCQDLEKKHHGRSPAIIFVFGAGVPDVEIINLANRLRRYSPQAAIAVYDNRKSMNFLLTFFRRVLEDICRRISTPVNLICVSILLLPAYIILIVKSPTS